MLESLEETLVNKWVAVSLRTGQAQRLIDEGRVSEAKEKMEWVLKAACEAIEAIRQHERELLDGSNSDSEMVQR